MKTIIIVFAILFLTSCAQYQQKNTRFYVVVDVTIHDLEKYNEFIELEAPILKKNGAFMVMDIRNEDQKRRYLVVSFPNREADKRMVKSKEFKDILPLSKESAKSKIFYGYSYK